jgi:hypothetical protein
VAKKMGIMGQVVRKVPYKKKRWQKFQKEKVLHGFNSLSVLAAQKTIRNANHILVEES